MEKVNYFDLSIHERINLRSGFDIPVAYEGKRDYRGKLITRFADCIDMKYLRKVACSREYNIDRFYISLRTNK
jgi:hypothetical protein